MVKTTAFISFKREGFGITCFLSFIFFGSIVTASIVSDDPETKSSFASKELEKDTNVLPNSSQYTWMGNHFIPPKGVPTYSPTDYLSYFSSRNTLFIGDSTVRRAYGTLFAVITSNSAENVPIVEMDKHNDLVNKLTGSCIINERLLFGRSSIRCRNLPVENPQGTHHRNTGKFDFIWSPCMKSFATFEATSIQKDYDLVVVGIGIWDLYRTNQDHCHMTVSRINENDGTKFNVILPNEERYDIPLDALSSASSPDLQVIFRTPGFSETHNGDDEIIKWTQYIKDYSSRLAASPSVTTSTNIPKDVDGKEVISILSTDENVEHEGMEEHSESKGTNFTVLDWGAVISKRSFGMERIKSDGLPIHYGLEGRLLFMQQLLHHLLALESR